MMDAARFDSLDVYSQTMLADGAELALVRSRRTGHPGQLDRYRLLQLLYLFEEALEANRAISDQMASSTDKSVTILGMVTEALAGIPLTAAVKTTIEDLKRTTEQAVDGKPLEERDFQKLTSFLRHYSLYQEDRVRRLRLEGGMGGGLWPEPTHTMSL